jgi:hypothetical protein
MGMISDAQEEIGMNQLELARKTMNRAKWLICEYKTRNNIR